MAEIQYTRKAQRAKDDLSENEKAIVALLEQDLRETNGKPHGRGWESLGPVRQLGDDMMHCHLTKKKVAVWKIIKPEKKNNSIVCRIEYVGTRDRAPY
jgi:hypothetical protein